MLLDELNVKAVTVVDASAELVAYVIKPNLPVLGPRLGKEVGRLRGALQGLEPAMAAQIAQAIAAGEAIEIEGFALSADDLLVEMREREGAASAQDASYTVAVRTETTPELLQEGLAREIVHRVQGMRREAGFAIADRIVLWVASDDAAVGEALDAYGGYIGEETLALELRRSAPDDDAYAAEETVGEATVRLGVRRSGQRGLT